MRIPSGTTDQYIYFVAVDATDLKTRETGLSSFTVYRSRDGAAAAAYTTPTINETDTTNMPGVYELLLDEDMTIGSGNDSEEICLHITQASMAPVTRVIELYRAKITVGETIGVSSGAVSAVTTTTTATNVTTVNGLAANVITAASMNADASAEIADAVWDEDATAHQTQGTFGQAIGDPVADTNTIFKAVVTDATGATVGVDAAAILADTGTDGVALAANSITASVIANGAIDAATFAADVDAEILSYLVDDATRIDASSLNTATVTSIPAILVDTGTTLDGKIDTIDTVVDAILVDTAEIGVAGAGLTAIDLPDQTMSITGNITGNLSGSVGSVTGISAANVTTGLTEVTAIKAKTDSLSFTVAGSVDANIQQVNDITITGDGEPGTEWGPI